jgi:hypothetical protein
MVHGVSITVIEETLTDVTGLSTIGTRWFIRKAHLPKAQNGFLVDDEKV